MYVFKQWWAQNIGVCVCVCVCVYLHNVPIADTVHVLHMRSADFRPRADTLEVRCWLKFQNR